MSPNLVELIDDQLEGPLAAHVDALLGEGSGKTPATLATAVPALLEGLVRSAATIGGADASCASVQAQEETLLDGLGERLAHEGRAPRAREGQTTRPRLHGPPRRARTRRRHASRM